MDEKLKFSIILPVYNAEKYLKDSLVAYTNQTYKNIEIICVNDGSTDNSIKILNNFANKDSRIKIIEQENSGPALARQNGLNQATGDYIWFVDADDSCELNSIEIIYKNINESNVDILYFGVKLIQNEYKNHPSTNYYGLKNVHNLRFNECLSLDKNAYLLFSLPRELWNKVYNRTFLNTNKLTFNASISLYDDILFTTKSLLVSTKIKLIKDMLYHYHMNHNGSIMETANKRLDGIFFYFEYMYNFLETSSFNLYIKRNWLCKEICSMNYWLTRKNINQKYYLKRLEEIYNKIDEEILQLVPNDCYQLQNKNKAIDIINCSYRFE